MDSEVPEADPHCGGRGSCARRAPKHRGRESSRVLLQKVPSLRKQFWGKHLWARGYLAVATGPR
jgi:REP element-mobilizing transposase RayT